MDGLWKGITGLLPTRASSQDCEAEGLNPRSTVLPAPHAPASILCGVNTEREGGWNRADDLERIKASYERYAINGRYRLWDLDSPGFAKAVHDVRRTLLRALHQSQAIGHSAVLDLGCGTGDLLALGGLDPETWTGVDLRENAVAVARSRFPAATFVTASADATPFEDASFDIVVSQVLFSSLPSRRLEAAVAAEIQRLLRPGGWLVWSDIRYSNPANPDVHGVSRKRLGELFPDWSSELELSGLLPPIARRLGRASPALYPVLSALPMLRSHLVGRLRAPYDARN